MLTRPGTTFQVDIAAMSAWLGVAGHVAQIRPGTECRTAIAVLFVGSCASDPIAPIHLGTVCRTVIAVPIARSCVSGHIAQIPRGTGCRIVIAALRAETELFLSPAYICALYPDVASRHGTARRENVALDATNPLCARRDAGSRLGIAVRTAIAAKLAAETS